MNNSINIDIYREKKNFNGYFKKLLTANLSDNYLDKVMLYSALNGGKRIRPYLVKQFSLLKNVKYAYYRRLAVAIEIIHSYSLIHDDLPSMDNDDFRRGKPSAHIKFNEAQAILAGDSLHDLAFEILSNVKTHPSHIIRINLVNQMSKSLGSCGLAGGQSLDLLYETKKVSLNKVSKMYRMKTGELFKFCCIGPFIMAKVTKKELEFASKYGEIFGEIFQIVDDHLDIVGNINKIGKTPGKDIKQKKSTFSNHFKHKNIKQYCNRISEKFINNNNYYFEKWPILRNLLNYLTDQLI